MIDGNLTDWFSVLVGVRQGCILSPMLFNIFLEFVMDELKSLNEFRLKNDMAADIRYADDTTLVSAIFSKLKLSTQELEIACMKWGLKINGDKCKIISPETEDIEINGEPVENVDSFVFLGSSITNTTDDVKRRIALACSAFGRLKTNLWNRRGITNALKTRLYFSLILPIAIYGSETWTLKAGDCNRLLVFENDCLRSLIGKSRRDRCKLKDIRSQLKVKKNIIEVIRKKRLLWFGHITRRGEESYVYRSYKQEFSGSRPRGRPPKRWSDQIRADLKMPLLTLERRAADRNRWKQYVETKRGKI